MESLDRDALLDLQRWFNRPSRKPLILRGARQVGKTTLVRQFAKIMNLDLIEINLELDRDLRKEFQSLNLKRIEEAISFAKGKTISQKSLLFIDEIQVEPAALTALRYFYEEKTDWAVIAAGSLLEFALGETPHSMPVGRVEFYFIGPLTFNEFVKNIGTQQVSDLLLTWSPGKIISEIVHNKLLDLYYEFLMVGGMPEAVREYKKTRQFQDVTRVHNSIILTYKSDFGKYAKRVPHERLESVFEYSLTKLGQKVKYNEICEGLHSNTVKNAIELLVKAQLVYKVLHSSASGIPLTAVENSKVYKFLALDVGLVSSAFKFQINEVRKFFESPPDGLIILHKGTISEQFVGQHLLYVNPFEEPALHYWLRELSTQKAEVDFLISQGTQIMPVEVKSGRTGSIKSLALFASEKNIKKVMKISTKPFAVSQRKNLEHSLELIEVPFYLIGYVRALAFIN